MTYLQNLTDGIYGRAEPWSGNDHGAEAVRRVQSGEAEAVAIWFVGQGGDTPKRLIKVAWEDA